MWQEFEQWLQQRFAPQFESLQQQGLKEGKQVTTTGYYNQPVKVQGDHLYYIRNDGYHQSELVKSQTGLDATKTIVLSEVHAGANFDVNAESSIVLTQLETCDEYNLYRDIYLLKQSEAEVTRLTTCQRYVHAIWSHDATHLLALQHGAGSFELHKLNLEGDLVEILWKSEHDEIMSSFDVSADGSQLVASIWRRGKGWNLERFDVLSANWHMISDDRHIQAYPEFDQYTGNIYFSADYSGIYNLYEYNTETKTLSQLSKVSGGAFQSSYDAINDQIYYVAYSPTGTNILRLDVNESEVMTPVADHTAYKPYNYEIKNLESEEYDARPSLKPRWWFPHLVLGESANEIGFTTSGNDALGLHNYAITLAYEIDNNIPLGFIQYSYSNRFSLAMSRNSSVYLDNNANFERARVSDTAQVSINFPFTRQLSRHNFVLAAIWDRESDKKQASGVLALPDFEDNVIAAAWLYNSSRRYSFSISQNDGMSLSLVIEDSDSLSSDYTGQVYTLDWKQYVRTGDESVLALRFVQGWGTDNPNPFRLGGEDTGLGLSLLGPTGQPVLGRREYPLRGYPEGLPQLRDRRLQLLSTEWRFPIERVERGFMAPPVGLMQWYGTLFAESGAAYGKQSSDNYYSSAGFEINADTNLFYTVPLTVRLGYAHGFDSMLGDDRVYLSLGASF